MLRLDAINLASTWYAEVDFGTPRVISKEWQRTFRIEQAYAKYVAQCQADCSQGASGPGYGGNNLPLRRSILSPWTPTLELRQTHENDLAHRCLLRSAHCGIVNSPKCRLGKQAEEQAIEAIAPLGVPRRCTSRLLLQPLFKTAILTSGSLEGRRVATTMANMPKKLRSSSNLGPSSYCMAHKDDRWVFGSLQDPPL